MFHGAEPAEELIRRELHEKIGACPTEITALGILQPSPGVIAECLHLYLVRINRIGAVDTHEAIAEVRTFSVPEFDHLVAAGEVTCGHPYGLFSRKLRGFSGSADRLADGGVSQKRRASQS